VRIIRGEFAGKSLITPTSKVTRPTSDKVRQAIFNIIEHDINESRLTGAVVLDIFAGTGGLGFEALSRGASKVIFVDNQRTAMLNIWNIIDRWNVKHRTAVYAQDVLTLPQSPYIVDFIFCDPPYGKNLVNLALAHLFLFGWITNHTIIIAEMHKQDNLNIFFPIEILKEKRYGDTKVIFLKLQTGQTVHKE
jgi:16S rRNA (guanine966-N2)-methyltransferase